MYYITPPLLLLSPPISCDDVINIIIRFFFFNHYQYPSLRLQTKLDCGMIVCTKRENGGAQVPLYFCSRCIFVCCNQIFPVTVLSHRWQCFRWGKKLKNDQLTRDIAEQTELLGSLTSSSFNGRSANQKRHLSEEDINELEKFYKEASKHHNEGHLSNAFSSYSTVASILSKSVYADSSFSEATKLQRKPLLSKNAFMRISYEISMGRGAIRHEQGRIKKH